MTDETRVLILRLNTLSDRALLALFQQLEHEGRAKAFGDEYDGVEQLLVGEGFEVVDLRAGAVTLCVGQRGDDVVLACDLDGPWAARLVLSDLDGVSDDDEPVWADLARLRPPTVQLPAV